MQFKLPRTNSDFVNNFSSNNLCSVKTSVWKCKTYNFHWKPKTNQQQAFCGFNCLEFLHFQQYLRYATGLGYSKIVPVCCNQCLPQHYISTQLTTKNCMVNRTGVFLKALSCAVWFGIEIWNCSHWLSRKQPEIRPFNFPYQTITYVF